MWSDILLQAAILLVMVFMCLYIHEIPQKLLTKLDLFARRSELQSKRHFVRGAKLLSQASSDRSIAEQAAAEADRAIALYPKDAAAHILKALALQRLGFNTSALDSLNAALSPLAAGSLSDAERGDALLKRAEIRIAANRDGALEDLVESTRLNAENAKAYALLGQCYEKLGLKDEARKAYEDAGRIRPEYGLARDGLDRLARLDTIVE